MKRHAINVLLASVATMAIVTVGRAQTDDRAREVLSAARQWEEAVATSDRAVLPRLAHPDLIVVSADGVVLHAPASVQDSSRPAAPNNDDYRVKVYSDVAAVVLSTRPGRQSEHRVLSLWVKAGGAWKIAAEQSTRIGGVAPGTVSGANSVASIASTDPSSDSGEDAAAVVNVELRFRTDVGLQRPLERIIRMYYGEDYFGVTRTGIVETRDDLFRRSAKGREQRRSTGPLPPAAPYRDVRTKVYGNTAVLTAEVVNAGQTVRILRVFVKRDGEWQFANSQSTQVAASRRH